MRKYVVPSKFCYNFSVETFNNLAKNKNRLAAVVQAMERENKYKVQAKYVDVNLATKWDKCAQKKLSKQ